MQHAIRYEGGYERKGTANPVLGNATDANPEPRVGMVRMRAMTGLVSSVTLVAQLAAQSVTGLRVRVQSGVVEGRKTGLVRTFLGIPYAAPPIAELRWKPPVSDVKWSGARKATEFGARCMQGPVFEDMKFRDAGGSEDCLFLNVWTSAPSSESKLPVMVWIHGGAFVAGSTSEPRQDGAIFAEHNVVLVSMNYRLGVFGFFVHPDLVKESGRHSAGNYGLLDQVAALRWVRDNIAAFGGDPGNVTIFGESAGSISVSALMASPLAKGLFQKAIGESGALFSNGGTTFDSLPVREERDSRVVQKTLGILTLPELRATPAQRLLEASFKPGGEENFAFVPDIDGYLLPTPLPPIFAARAQNDVPLLAGWNRDEGSFEIAFAPEKPTVASMRATAKQEFGAQADRFLRLYPAETDVQAIRSTEDFAGDRLIAWATWQWLEAQSTSGKQRVYRYRFDRAPPSNGDGPRLGAYHSAEIEYVFGQLESKANAEWRPADRKLSQQMQRYWINFARSGDPNDAGLPRWPVYSPSSGWQVMHLDETPAARPDDQRDRYLFLNSVWAK